MVGDIQRDTFRLFGDAGITWRAPELGQQRRRGEFPRQRVFATTGTDEENVHNQPDQLQSNTPIV
jgi:hypothetical protein